MYRTCAHPHCTTPFDRCEIHHVTAWDALGPTDLANLLPLCSFHHHCVHEGGWTLTLDPDRTITLTRPDGDITFDDTTTDRHPQHRATPAERATTDRTDRPPG